MATAASTQADVSTTAADTTAATTPPPSNWDASYHSAGNIPGAHSGRFQDYVTEGPMGGIWQRDNLLGDMGGLRSYLGSYGISLNLQETSEVLGNTTGGIKQSADYDGLTTADVTLDTQRAFGWRGGTFNASVLQVHGSNLSADNLDNLQTASGIEADRGIRLWELWYDQAFFYNTLDVKVGQQSLDQEFMVSQYSGLFVNTMFGWPMLPSADLPSGGGAYPLSSVGGRVRYQPVGPFTFLAGVFNDNPGGPCQGGDSQVCDNRGTNFRVNDDPFYIAEIQFARPALGDLEYTDRAPPLPGVYRLGFWYDQGRFADQQYGADGLSLANPLSNGAAKLHRGDYSAYLVIDQLLWRESPESEEGLGFFFRGMIAPSDRNLVDMSLNAGLTYREPFEHREDDIVGLGMGFANVSSSASALDRDAQFYSASATPVRSNETFIEATYQYTIAPWWQLQPDVQYVFNPGGGVANPDYPGSTGTLGNELVVGLRTNITF
jgi:porin